MESSAEIPKKGGGDIEAGHGGTEAGAGPSALYPNMTENPQLRWAFIRKVYSIVSLQIFLTIAVAAVINFVDPVRSFFVARTTTSLAVKIVIIVSPFLFLIPMFCFRQRHPINLVLLILFTICLSSSIGMACATSKGIIVLEAASLTAIVVVGLTVHTFWAAKAGCDFTFLGPFMTTTLCLIMCYCIMQIIFPMKITTTIYSCAAAIIFTAFLIYDTGSLIKRHRYDQYICASLSLYLDVVNPFTALLTLMGVIRS